MAWGYVQGKSVSLASGAGPVGSVTLVLTANPTQGNLVALGFAFLDAANNQVPTIQSIKDANNNSYTLSPKSPTTYNNSYGMMWLAFLLVAPANASKTITVTFASAVGAGGSITYVLFADEFSISGGAMFVADGKSSGFTAGSTGILLPVIVISSSGTLMYSVAASSSGITAINSPYTHAADLTSANGGFQWGEYNMVSGPGSTAVGYADSSTSDPYAALAMTFVPAADQITQGGDWNVAIV